MSNQAAIYSSFDADPDFAELVQWFVKALPLRMRAMDRAFHGGDLSELGRLAHQMKGAAGSYGFPQITLAADELEHAVRLGDSRAAIEQRFRRLSTLCQQARVSEPERDIANRSSAELAANFLSD